MDAATRARASRARGAALPGRDDRARRAIPQMTKPSRSRLISEPLGVPAAPVFWAATDDADFLEASVTTVADADGLRELRSTTKPTAGTPMAAVELGDTKRLIDDLRRACGSAANAAFFDLVKGAFTH